MSDYIKRVKDCMNWFQQLEENYVSQNEKLNDLLGSSRFFQQRKRW
jgi:hypothetical protein